MQMHNPYRQEEKKIEDPVLKIYGKSCFQLGYTL